jgi:hypothetical protein
MSDGPALFGKRMAYLKVLKHTSSVFAAEWDGFTFNALTDFVATFSTGFSRGSGIRPTISGLRRLHQRQSG